MVNTRFPFVVMALVLGLSASSSAQSGELVDGLSRRMDVAFLDSLLGSRMTTPVFRSGGLASRDDLLEAMLASGPLDRLDWALALHSWLRSANDPHMRIPFDRLTQFRSGALPPQPIALVDPTGLWSRFGPGMGVSPSGRAAWLMRTWSWVSVLAERGSVEDRMRADVFVKQSVVDSLHAAGSSMEVVDHGAFVRWRIVTLGGGTERAYRKSFRRCFRQLRRLGKPVMLDLRGNLGGYRTRRHAVLGAFVPLAEWEPEQEKEWASDADFESVPPMPLVRVRRPLRKPVAVLLDGLSFSASLLLAQSLETSGRASVFGCAPLGQYGGCSGNPLSFFLPGSGLEVLLPTRQTRLGASASGPFRLPSGAGCQAGGDEWNRAVLWLLSSDLEPSR